MKKSTKKKYEFNGWWTHKTSEKSKYKITTIKPSKSKFQKNITVYAHWLKIHTVKYKGLNGASAPKATTYTKKESVKLNNPGTRAGYKFDGWYTAKSGGKKVTKIAKKTDKNTTVYAQWLKVHSVKYEGLEGASAPKATTFTKKETPALNAPGEREGYVFDGWYTAAAGDESAQKVDRVPANTDGDITVYAHWKLAIQSATDSEGTTATDTQTETDAGNVTDVNQQSASEEQGGSDTGQQSSAGAENAAGNTGDSSGADDKAASAQKAEDSADQTTGAAGADAGDVSPAAGGATQTPQSQTSPTNQTETASNQANGTEENGTETTSNQADETESTETNAADDVEKKGAEPALDSETNAFRIAAPKIESSTGAVMRQLNDGMNETAGLLSTSASFTDQMYASLAPQEDVGQQVVSDAPEVASALTGQFASLKGLSAWLDGQPMAEFDAQQETYGFAGSPENHTVDLYGIPEGWNVVSYGDDSSVGFELTDPSGLYRKVYSFEWDGEVAAPQQGGTVDAAVVAAAVAAEQEGSAEALSIDNPEISINGEFAVKTGETHVANDGVTVIGFKGAGTVNLADEENPIVDLGEFPAGYTPTVKISEIVSKTGKVGLLYTIDVSNGQDARRYEVIQPITYDEEENVILDGGELTGTEVSGISVPVDGQGNIDQDAVRALAEQSADGTEQVTDDSGFAADESASGDTTGVEAGGAETAEPAATDAAEPQQAPEVAEEPDAYDSVSVLPEELAASGTSTADGWKRVGIDVVEDAEADAQGTATASVATPFRQDGGNTGIAGFVIAGCGVLAAAGAVAVAVMRRRSSDSK